VSTVRQMGESPPASYSNNKRFVFVKWREAQCCDVTLADCAHYARCVQLLPRTDLPSCLYIRCLLPSRMEIIYILRLVFIYISSVRTIRNNFAERNCCIIYTLRLYGT